MTQDQVSLNLINLFKDLKEPDPVNDTAGTADGNNNSLQLTPCTSVWHPFWIFSQLMDVPSGKLRL
jgi:hypothetical protein